MNSVQSCQWNRQKGFTLLELVLAITFLSMVALIIGSGFRLGIKAWEKGEAEARETQRLRALSGLISQSIKSAFPYTFKKDNRDVVIFEGDANSILFVTTLADASSGGFRWIRYAYDEGKFVFNEGMLPDKDFLEKIKENQEIIDDDIGEITFSYLSSEDEEWKDIWEMGDGMPSAVKVKIAYFQPFLITLPLGLDKQKQGLTQKSELFK
jgi:general secretion pathway protein J